MKRLIGLFLGVPALFLCHAAGAQEILLNVTYVCGGERLVVDGCDIHDLSETSHCFVGHPDHVKDGMMAYSNTTRGELKKLLPTCQQPSAAEIAKRQEFARRMQAIQDENQRRADAEMRGDGQSPAGGPALPPEKRRLARCVSSVRPAAACTGNALSRGFDELTGHVMSAVAPDLPPGPEFSGAFAGAGGWHIDFSDRGATLTCSGLVADSYTYKLEMRDSHAYVTLSTGPRAVTLALRGDSELVGPGPVAIDGRIITGYRQGGSYTTAGHMETQQVTTHQELTPLEAQQYAGQSGLSQNGQTYDMASNSSQSSWAPGQTVAAGPQPIFAAKRASCAAPVLSTKGAGPSSTQATTGLLTALFSGGDQGPPAPNGIRMHGIYASNATGFSVEFHPESAVLGCGPDAARAYPYTVHAEGNHAVVEVDVPEHPLKLVLNADGSLNPGSNAAYPVHGRVITGQSGDNFTFAPLERSCELAELAPAKDIPQAEPARMRAAFATSTGGTGSADASLTIKSGLQVAAGQASPLANMPIVLLKTSFDDVVRIAGARVPAGTVSIKYFAQACASHSPDCMAIANVYKANIVAGVRADSAGNAILPPLPAGTYYLFISARLGTEPWMWLRPVEIHSGQNQVVLDLRNGTRMQ